MVDDPAGKALHGRPEPPVDGDRYRSYVVRVWPRPSTTQRSARTLIEEVQSGRQVDLRGERAAEIAARISAVLAPASSEAGSESRRRSPEPESRQESDQEGRMILVVGATGSLGGTIARRLAEEGRDVRVLVRPGSAYGPLVELGCEPVFGDLKEPASLVAACAGVDTVVTTAISLMRMPPDTLETVELAGYASLFAAAAATGVRHVVYTSALMADRNSPIPFAAAKAVAGERLVASGMDWTILAPDAFMDVWLAMVVAGPALAGREVVYVGGGDRVHQFIHSDDVASFAIACVDNPAARNRFLRIGGPSAISLRDAVATFEGALGQPIQQRGVAAGEPVPGLPPMVLEMLAGLDAFDSRLDMAPLATEFGVELTSADAWARHLVPVPTG